MPDTIARRLRGFPLTVTMGASARVSYRSAGRGVPLVLLHGIGTESGSWLQQLEQLSRRFRVIAWDAPGYGLSSPLSVATPMASDYAQALYDLLDAIDVDRCLLVGQSLGAMMATAFARQHPSRLHGLVLLGPARGYGGADATVRAAKLEERLRMMRELGPEGMAERRSANLLSGGASDFAHALVSTSMRMLRPDGYAQAARLLAEGDLQADAPHYPGPTFVACGTADEVTPEANCRAIAGRFADWQYRALPGVGHASYVEAPEAVDAIIARFAVRTGALRR